MRGGCCVNQPLVSVVVPIYNVEKYLNRCIESIVNQTYFNLEIILVDDGSPDKCPVMCDEWAMKDSRIKVIHKENAGLGMARNTGMDSAEGKYIFFFDSDDYVDTAIVEKCVFSAEKNGSDVVIFGRCDIYEDGTVIPKSIKSDREAFLGASIINELLPSMFTYSMGFGVSAWGKMYNLNTLRALGKGFMSEREIISEDAYFAVDLYSDVSVVTIVFENLYYYFKRGDSLSRVYKEDRQRKNDIFYEKTLDLIKRKNMPRDVLLHMTARYQMYSVSTMKQIMASDLSDKEKTKELRRVYKSRTLLDTLHRDVINLHNRSLQMFYLLLKMKCYLICDTLLRIKLKQEV